MDALVEAVQGAFKEARAKASLQDDALVDRFLPSAVLEELSEKVQGLLSDYQRGNTDWER